MASRTTIFIHIPKAAGTTIDGVLKREYGLTDSFTTNGANPKLSIEQLKELPEVELQRLRLIKGHMPFGVHRYLKQPATYFTFLRSPEERIISHYYYVLRAPRHYLHEQVQRERITLAEYATAGLSKELDNGMTRKFAADDPPYGECDDRLLRQAVDNIDRHVAVVGIVENFDESLLLARSRLQWRKHPFYHQQNVTRTRPAAEDVPPEALAAIMRHNDLDRRLHQHYRERLFEQLETVIPAWKRRLARFRVMNRLYNNAVQMQSKARSVPGFRFRS